MHYFSVTNGRSDGNAILGESKHCLKQSWRNIPLHWSVLHISVSSRSGQAAPPFCGSSTTSLVLVLVPPLQVALQSPQAVQSPTWQSTKYPQLVKRCIMKRWRESTWASLSVAGRCLIQSPTRSSSVQRFLNDLPCSRLGSSVASCSAFTPLLPFPNFAVN